MEFHSYQIRFHVHHVHFKVTLVCRIVFNIAGRVIKDGLAILWCDSSSCLIFRWFYIKFSSCKYFMPLFNIPVRLSNAFNMAVTEICEYVVISLATVTIQVFVLYTREGRKLNILRNYVPKGFSLHTFNNARRPNHILYLQAPDVLYLQCVDSPIERS